MYDVNGPGLPDPHKNSVRYGKLKSGGVRTAGNQAPSKPGASQCSGHGTRGAPERPPGLCGLSAAYQAPGVGVGLGGGSLSERDACGGGGSR